MARPNVDGTLGTVRLAVASVLYNTHTDACATDTGIHSDGVKHSPLGLLSSYGRERVLFP